MMRTKGKRTESLFFCLGILAAGMFFQAGGLLKGNRVVFPPVSEILQALIRLLEEGTTWTKIITTLVHVAEALAVSAAAGILIGLAEGLSRSVYAFFRPVMILIRSMPMIVTVILIMSALSYKSVPVTAASLILIPAFSEAVYEGCRSLDPELMDVYRLNGGFGPFVARKVYLPLISGYLRQAFVQSAGTGLKICVSAEYLVQTKNSLGKAVYSSGYFSEYAEIYAYALIMVFLVLALTEIPPFLLRTIKRKKGFRQEP